ncbi:MAG: hypothetical protein Q9222_000820, partial [Ikaeria aurantiellina]
LAAEGAADHEAAKLNKGETGDAESSTHGSAKAKKRRFNTEEFNTEEAIASYTGEQKKDVWESLVVVKGIDDAGMVTLNDSVGNNSNGGTPKEWKSDFATCANACPRELLAHLENTHHFESIEIHSYPEMINPPVELPDAVKDAWENFVEIRGIGTDDGSLWVQLRWEGDENEEKRAKVKWVTCTEVCPRALLRHCYKA